MTPHRSKHFKHSQILLLAHGSETTPEGTVYVHKQADALRRRDVFGDVRATFLRDSPHPRDIIATSEYQNIYVVPFMVSEGHSIDVIIPDALELSKGHTMPDTSDDAKHITLCNAIGTHSSIRRQSCKTIEKLKSEQGLSTNEVSALVLCHGTKRHKGSRKYAEQVLHDIQNSGHVAEAAMLFLEEAPRIDEWRSYVSTRYVIALPYLMTAGRHGAYDIPELLGIDTSQPSFHDCIREGKTAGPFNDSGRILWYTPLVGTFDIIPDIIVERVTEQI